VTAPEGILLVDKRSGSTSHDAVAHVRRALGTKKVGHAGTLDPMASGLLVVGVGRATRLLRFIGSLPKTYVGTFRLGVQTTTLDADGDVTRTTSASTVTDAALRAAMTAKLGTSEQRPPAFSAVKVGGRKLYEAARSGQTLEASTRPVRIDRFDLLARRGDDVDFEAIVGGGTYVRVLVADVGEALGVGAHLIALRRTAVGAFDVADAAPPDEPGPLLPAESAVAHLPHVAVDEEEAVAASHGRILGPAGLDGPYGVYDSVGRLIGIWRDDDGKARPEMVLARA
jgi:tRNA pseudouridine55 synthase